MVQIPRTSLEQLDIQATLELILKNAVQTLGGGAGMVAVWDEAELRFIPRASCGLDAAALEILRPLLAEAAPDLANSRESFNFLSELQPDQELPSSNDGIRQNPIIALPLKIGGKSIGIIYILRSEAAGAFSQVDQPVLTAFAEQAAVAVQNAKLAILLAEEKQRVESILENSADGIMSIDCRCRILGFNAAMEKMTGYLRDEVLGQECFRVLQFTDSEKHNLCNMQCPMLLSSATNSPVFEHAGSIRAKDGKSVDVDMVYSIVRAPDGKPINAVVNVRNMTKMREMENFREAVLSMLGHELQTPLSIIKGYTSTLSRTDGQWDTDTIRQGLQVIEEESDRLSLVMSKLLLASRLSAGALKLNKEPVQLPAMVQKIVRRLSGLASHHSLQVDFAVEFPAVMVEPQLMEQTLTNLIENAIKYSPDGGRVNISGRQTEQGIEVTIADEGIGIPVGEMEHLFERFHRVPQGQSKKIQGTGLGLYICKAIIEAHGGKLTASSQLGQGSQFTFVLPVEKND